MDPYSVCRFGLLMDPLDKTGLVLVRFANLYWLVTVSGFQGSSCSGFPTYPAVLPAACRLTLFRRRGDTLRIRLDRVNSFSEHFFDRLRAVFLAPDRRLETPSDSLGRRPQDSMSAASTRLPCSYVIVSERLSVFNTRSGLLLGSGGAATKITTHVRCAQEVLRAPLRYPAHALPRRACRAGTWRVEATVS